MTAMPRPLYDVAIVGAGFYGCRTALLLARLGLKVLVLEREKAPCLRASRNNQARIHNGYHYPRSLMTALGSHKHYRRFMEDFSACVMGDFKHIYAVAGQYSKITPNQFERFCRQLDIPLALAPPSLRGLFDRHRVEAVYLADEVALDTHRLGTMLAGQMCEMKGITLALGCEVARVNVRGDGVEIVTRQGVEWARQVVVVGYGGLNDVLVASGLPPLPLKAEMTEMALVSRPAPLREVGVTVMDGPFFSIMPYRPDGVCTLSHVRYTPRRSVDLSALGKPMALSAEVAEACGSAFPFMRNDAARYMPAMRDVVYRGSLWETKVVPLKNEMDDGRPILFLDAIGRLGDRGPAVAAVLGSKLDSIYEWEEALRARFG